MTLSKELVAEAQPWVEAALRLGAAEAKAISPASVVTAPWVRLKCQYGCGGYGRRLTCPPYSPTPEQTRAVLDCYQLAVLVHFPREWRPLRELVSALEREAFLGGNYQALGLGAGSCHLCPECDLTSCQHPREARPSMEASGIDVYATARNNGYPLQVTADHNCEPNYYGLVLIR